MTELRDAEATIRTYADRVRQRLLRQLVDNHEWNRLVDIAVERATGLGAQQYGNATYERSIPEVQTEADHEVADWIFYSGVIEELLAASTNEQEYVDV